MARGWAAYSPTEHGLSRYRFIVESKSRFKDGSPKTMCLPDEDLHLDGRARFRTHTASPLGQPMQSAGNLQTQRKSRGSMPMVNAFGNMGKGND